MSKARHRVSFEAYYENLFPDRWPGLKAALLGPNHPTGIAFDQKPSYYLDSASLLCALALGPLGDSDAADLCAAPGGKTLVLAASLGPQGSIVANEFSGDRRARLARVLDEHLEPGRRERISVSGRDARQWGLQNPGRHDAVLVDVPCSSERHLLLAGGRHLEQWSPARSRHLAAQAYAILTSALLAVKPGGLVLYSTCALDAQENAAVCERVLSKKPARALDALSRIRLHSPQTLAILGFSPEALDQALSAAEPDGPGVRFLPDTAYGMGPLFFCLFQRNPDSAQ